MPKKEFSLYLDAELVSKFDERIVPFHRSNVIHQLISEFLEKKRKPSPQRNPGEDFLNE